MNKKYLHILGNILTNLLQIELKNVDSNNASEVNSSWFKIIGRRRKEGLQFKEMQSGRNW